KKHQPEFPKEDVYFLKELILWGLVSYKKLNKNRFEDGYQFKDVYGSFISDL
ncbi:MAG: magnesium chelatase subunit I, partial [Maribacter sp.]